MAREIKFRTWDGKEMYDVANLSFFSHGELKGKVGISISNGRIGLEGNLDGVLPILMQYTGLKNKRGIEIYDGDVITGEVQNEFGSMSKMTGVVGWCEHNSNWAIYPGKMEDPHYFLDNDCIILGNIYQNPELKP